MKQSNHATILTIHHWLLAISYMPSVVELAQFMSLIV